MFIRNLLLAPVLAACAFGQGSTGTTTITRDYSFPPAGIGNTETAQVNVVNIAAPSTNPTATAPSCTGTITFANAAGTTIGTPFSFATTGGAIVSTQLTFSKLAETGVHAGFLASVQSTTAIPAKTPCSLLFSLETFDSVTGVTHLFLENSAATTAPGPVPVVGH